MSTPRQQAKKRGKPEQVPQPEEGQTEKNPAAVALGRLGGLKGGPARARKLSAKRRRDIAQSAARARWKKDQTTS